MAKKMITVFVLDNKDVKGITDAQGNSEKNPMLHSLACTYDDNKDIGTKLLTAGPDDVFHAEDIEAAIANYSPEEKEPTKKKKEPKKDKKEPKGSYDTKVMTPSK